MDGTEPELRARANERLGTVVRGKYRLERVLGIGGMGTVYEARHRNTGRFALKILHPELCSRESVRKRLQREGYAANAVSHAGVVRVVDDDVTEDGAAFLVMDLLDGASVETIEQDAEGRLPIGVTLAIVLQALGTLAAAHATRIIHRDIKPANLFVTTDGVVKLLDFGIARALDGPEASAQLTGAGVPLGTPSFMAPEQALARSAEIDERTDIWAMGATLFALLSGRMVHQADTAAGVLVQAATAAAPALATVAPGVPAAVAAVVDRALAFDNKERWAGAREMADALERARVDGGVALPSGKELGALAVPRPSPLSSRLDPFGPTVEPAAPPTLLDTPAQVSKAPSMPSRGVPRRRTPARVAWAGAALALLLATGGAIWARHRRAPARVSGQLRVLVEGFDVGDNEPLLEKTLDRLLLSALEASTVIDPYMPGSEGELHAPTADAPSGATDQPVDPEADDLIVVRGAVHSAGHGYRLSLRAARQGNGPTIAVVSRDAEDTDHVVGAVAQLARDLRAALGDRGASPELAGGAGLSESIEADHEFASGSALIASGQYREATRPLERAVAVDPGFNTAHWGLATAYYNAGRFAEATREYGLAARPGHTSRRVALQIRGDHEAMLAHYSASAAAYNELLATWPGDRRIQIDLAETYVVAHEPRRALEVGRAVALASPRSRVAATNLGVYELLTGDFEAATVTSKQLVDAFPRSARMGATTLGISLALLGRVDEATAALRTIEHGSPALAAYDLADLAMFEGREDEAAAQLERYAAVENTAKGDAQAAHAWSLFGEVELRRGHRAEAILAADKAASSREPWALRSAGVIYLRAHDEEKATALSSLLQDNLGPDTPVVARLFAADLLRARGDQPAALRTLQDAQRTADAWVVHLELARTHLELGDVARARDELLVCMARRGEGALATGMYDVPTLRYVREASDLLASLSRD
jgi:serine/threonine protein kinase/Flp pilus assembly protein TadD